MNDQWTAEGDHPFAGIATKLERADQNIIYLAAEILGFFEKSKYPVIPDPNDQQWQEAVDYHRHERAKRLHENALGFPILCELPDKNRLAGFKRQIQGVDKPSVRKLITDLQPYQSGADPANDPLCIIHDMDRFDKHRELVIVTACANLTFPGSSPETIAKVMAYWQGTPLSTADVAAVQRAVKQEAKVFPQVAFAKFGKREGEFVVPSLVKLLHAVNDVARLFAAELFLLLLILSGFLLRDPIFQHNPRHVAAFAPMLVSEVVKPGQQIAGDPNADYDGIDDLRCHSLILGASKSFVNNKPHDWH